MKSKENLSPILKKTDQNIAKNSNSFSNSSRSVRSKTPEKGLFKVFTNTSKIQFQDQAKDFISFRGSPELQDITNSSEGTFWGNTRIEKDPNVQVLKELKQENEEELQNLMNLISEKMIENAKKDEVLSRLVEKKSRLNHEFQELIKSHSSSLETLQIRKNNIQFQYQKLSLMLKVHSFDSQISDEFSSFFDLENRIKSMEEKNDVKSRELFSHVHSLTEEIANFEELKDFKRKQFTKEMSSLKARLDQMNSEVPETGKLDQDFRSGNIEETREKIRILRDNINSRRKLNEFTLDSVTQDLASLNEALAFVTSKSDEISSQNDFLITKIAEFTKTAPAFNNTKETPPSPRKIDGLRALKKDLERLSIKKQYLEDHIKELFSRKADLENQGYMRIKRGMAGIETDKVRLSELILSQERKMEDLGRELKEMSERRFEEYEYMESLRIGAEKQRNFLQHS